MIPLHSDPQANNAEQQKGRFQGSSRTAELPLVSQGQIEKKKGLSQKLQSFQSNDIPSGNSGIWRLQPCGIKKSTG